MDANARAQFLKSELYRDLRAMAGTISASDADFVAEASTLILRVLLGSGKGPYTMLIPTEEAIDKLPVDVEADLTPEQRQGMLGVLLDTFLYGTLLSDGIDAALEAQEGGVELMTAGGGVLKAVRENGSLMLIDPFGVSAAVSGPVFKGPVTVCHRIDAVLMWDEWMREA
jgi:uncharacterized surface protein with fasciclin (FAS1) repeats